MKIIPIHLSLDCVESRVKHIKTTAKSYQKSFLKDSDVSHLFWRTVGEV